LLGIAKRVRAEVPYLTIEIRNFLKAIETYSEFPHLKELNCRIGISAISILAKSQVEEFSIDCLINLPALMPLFATQSKLKKVSVSKFCRLIDAEALINSLPVWVQSLSF
jgi:hypothetical protein